MLYYREITDFLRYHPESEFKMINLIRMISGSPADKKEWERKRKAVRRVMDELVRMGFVIERPPRAATGSCKRYRWKPGHAVARNRE